MIEASALAVEHGLTELPDVQQAELSASELNAYLFDVVELATELEVSYRTELRGPNIALETPEELSSLLYGGLARAARLSYRFQGKTWLDTLMCGPCATRLVRIARPG